MAGLFNARGDTRVRLVHDGLMTTLVLPFWPSDVSRDLPVRTWTELERANLRPLTVPGGLTNPTMSIGYTARNEDLYESIALHVSALADMAKHPGPVRLMMGRDDRDLWHLESVAVTEIEWNPDGKPSVVDITLSLRRATDVTVNVGLIKRRRNQKPPAADKQGNLPKNKKSPEYAKAYARQLMKKRYGWGDAEYKALVNLWNRESGWNYKATNRSSGAYGIPQSLPASKMASAGSDWRTNPETQIKWGLGYIKDRYGTPSKAWAHFQANNWY